MKKYDTPTVETFCAAINDVISTSGGEDVLLDASLLDLNS